VNYKSVNDLFDTIRRNSFRLQKKYDLIVGIPRSGCLAAYGVALNLNLPAQSLQEYKLGLAPEHGTTRAPVSEKKAKRRVLIVDDSAHSGRSLEIAKNSIAQIGDEVTTCAIYSHNKCEVEPDLYFEQVSIPRVFEWNLFHRTDTINMCFDLDGVFCEDPTDYENDDGEKYKTFINNVAAKNIPTYEIGDIVSARLEKYRPQTEQWLKKNGIKYRNLHLIDLPSAVERQKLAPHASFKASIYGRLTESKLFIESDARQAREIADMTGKPVFCMETNDIFYPHSIGNIAKNKVRDLKYRILKKIRPKSW